MPKYYRFRATTPTRKVRQIKDKDKSKEVQKVEKSDKPALGLLGGLTLEVLCAPAPTWYLRRTAWRENTTMMSPIRHLANVAGRPVFVVKLHSSDIERYL